MFFNKKDIDKEEVLNKRLEGVDPSTLVSAFNHDVDDILDKSKEYPEGTIFLDDDIVIPPDLDLKAKLKKP